MTPEKILSVVQFYRERFEKEGIVTERMGTDEFFYSHNQMLSHAYCLLDGVEKFISEGEGMLEKANKHLGSLQTLLWTAGWYTLGELMEHNRP